MRRGLTLAGTQRCFQFPAQALSFLFQALVFFPQPVIFLLRPVQLAFRNKLDALRLSVCQRAGQLVSSNPKVAETAPFVQQNLQAADFRCLSGW